MGIPCSLLIFISLATSKRGLYGHDIFGDESLSCVVKSNMHLSRACLLAMVCMARNVFWAAEQPSTSKLPQIPYYWELLSDPLLQTYFTRLSGTPESVRNDFSLPADQKEELLDLSKIQSSPSPKLDGGLAARFVQAIDVAGNLVQTSATELAQLKLPA